MQNDKGGWEACEEHSWGSSTKGYSIPRRIGPHKRTGQNLGPKARVGKGLAPFTSAVLLVGQRNQIHRVSGGLSSLIIIKELANQSTRGLRNKIRKMAVGAFVHSTCPYETSWRGNI